MVQQDQSLEIKTFSKDQAWSYDQPKVQVWPLIRRTHQAVLLIYDQAWSLENVFNFWALDNSLVPTF